ncbi:hypothetical protein AAVH_17120 [Aphelenchoides avenae]|nr:hypothetical protein AAVH_17120 [Aphelenchus avenae]
MSFLLLRVQYVGFGVLIAIAFEWVPAVNPVTTIFMVGPYRRQFFGYFCKKLARVHGSSSHGKPSAVSGAMDSKPNDLPLVDD